MCTMNDDRLVVTPEQVPFLRRRMALLECDRRTPTRIKPGDVLTWFPRWNKRPAKLQVSRHGECLWNQSEDGRLVRSILTASGVTASRSGGVRWSLRYFIAAAYFNEGLRLKFEEPPMRPQMRPYVRALVDGK